MNEEHDHALQRATNGPSVAEQCGLTEPQAVVPCDFHGMITLEDAFTRLRMRVERLESWFHLIAGHPQAAIIGEREFELVQQTLDALRAAWDAMKHDPPDGGEG